MNKKKISNYCPLNRIKKRIKSDYLEYEVPLFPNFVFVNIEDSQMEMIKSIKGVINFLFWLGRPVKLRNIEIDRLMIFVKNYKNININKVPVQLKSLMLIDKNSIQTETVFDINSEGIVSYSLPCLGFSLTAFADEKKDPYLMNNDKIKSEWDTFYSKY